jgi:DNA-binding Xre family transcriptional regulator
MSSCGSHSGSFARSQYGYDAPMQNRLSTIMREKGVTREALAERVGAHPVTISKLISGKMGMTVDWMERLGEALDVDPLEIISPPARIRTATVKSHVQAGSWRDAFEWEDQSDWYEVAVPRDPQLDGMPLSAYEVRGISMNKRYIEGTVLIATAPWDDRERPTPGARYIVERRKPDGMIEGTVKTLHRADDGKLWLVPESTDPRFQAAIPLDDGQEDGIEIRIVGRVRYAVSRE